MLPPWEDGCLPVTLSVLLVCVSPRASTGAVRENGGRDMEPSVLRIWGGLNPPGDAFLPSKDSSLMEML